MDNSKYGKYIVTELKENIAKSPWSTQKTSRRAGKGSGGRILWLDNQVVPGAFYIDSSWTMPRKNDETPLVVANPHKHDYDEVLCMFGSNQDDPHDLGGEVEFSMGDEKHAITKSCIIFIPKGLLHGPLFYKRVDRPIFNLTTGAGKMYF